MTPEIQTIIIVVTNIIIGVILVLQIRSQKQIISGYKGLIEATSPDKIILLQKREIEQIAKINSATIDELKTQVYQLGSFAVHSIIIFENGAATTQDRGGDDFFDRNNWMNQYMPNCVGIVNEIYNLRYDTNINAKK